MFSFLQISLDRLKKYIFFLLLFLFVYAISIKYNLLDFDLWARLINGQYVFYNFLPLKEDFYSFAPTHTWYDPEWLSSALIYAVQSKFGFNGLVFTKSCLSFGFICFLIYTLKCLKVKNNVFNLFYFIIFVLIMKQVGYFTFTFRCQLFSFFFFAFWLLCLEKARKGNYKYLWLLPIVMLFWQNMHGACIAGFGTLFIYTIGELFNKKPIKKYLVVFAIISVLLIVNPWGIEYYKFLFNSIFVERSYISEWKSLFFYLKFYYSFYFYYILIFIFAYIFQIFQKKLTIKTIDKTKFLMILVLLYLSCFHLKHVILALIGFSVYLYDDVFDTFSYIANKIKNKFFINLKVFLNIIFALTVFVYSCLTLVAYSTDEICKESLKYKYPLHALEFLKINNINGNILSPFQFASYIGYKYYPDLKIYNDGRQEQVYDYSVIKKSLDFFENVNIQDNIVDEYKPDIVLLERYLSVNEYLNKKKDYFLIYSDNTYNLFVLNKYKKLKQSYIKPIINIEYYMQKLFDTNIDFTKDNKK